MKLKNYYFLMLFFTVLLSSSASGLASKDSDPKPITNPKASVEGMTVTLSWDAPDYQILTALDEKFAQPEVPSAWLNIDSDGDTRKWESADSWMGKDATYWLGSWSWITGEFQNPDNWLIPTYQGKGASQWQALL